MLKIKNFETIKKIKPIIIICGGQSTKQIDWEWLKKYKNKIDTFGLNNAYKTYQQLDFYPTYYANLDQVVIQSHKEKIQKLIKENKIKKFFLHGECEFEKHATYQPVNKIIPAYRDLSCDFKKFHTWMNTGSDAVQISIMLGYKQIYVIGVDGYIEMPKGKQKKGIVYEMIDTPKKNSNYWFDNYIEKGEIYNLPNAEFSHKPGWEKAIRVCSQKNIKITNLSGNDYIRAPKLSFIEFTNKIEKID